MSHSNPTAEEMKRNAEQAGREAQRDFNEGANRVASDVRDTANKMGDNSGMERLKDKGAELAQNARETGEDYANRARAEAGRLYETGQQRATEVAHYAEDRYDEVSEMVRRNPAQSLGIAAGIGFLVGLILARR